MLRLFGVAGLVVLVASVLAIANGALYLRVLTFALAVIIYGLYWYLRRSLPLHRGKLSLPGLHEPVEVFWDDQGVPHIYARNSHDMYMAQGYVTASDRLWSMDLTRRAASGRLAELFGMRVLPLDRHFRTIGLHRAAADALSAYSPEALGHLEAYAAGVNARIAERRWPPEFNLQRCQPEPWSPVDTLTIARYLAYGLSASWTGQLFRAQLVKAVGAEMAQELFALPADPLELEAIADVELPDVDRLLALGASMVRAKTGGNGWVVGGAKSKSGAALLANDPHLAASNPAPWYQTHLIGPNGMDVTGAAFPGVPGILLGHNRDIAWGMTNQPASAQDLVIEQRNPDALDQFRFRGGWEKAVSVREEIRVRDAAQPVQHDVLITRHGPVIAAGRTTALALRWTGFEPSAEIESVLAVNRARSWGDFRQALQGYGAPALHFLFAGRDGTIACRIAGTIPLRTGGDGQIPVPGWNGLYEWRGAVPFEAHPEQVNPEAGFIVAAGGETAYRGRRVAERLHASTAVTVDKLQDLQQDSVNTQARSLLQILLHAIQEGLRQGTHPESLSPTEKRAMLMISGWDCSEPPQAPQPALWHQWFVLLTEEIFRPQMGLALFDQFIAHGMPGPTTDQVIHRVARGEESRWLSREGEGSLGRAVLRSFRRAVALLAAKHGQQPDRWAWGQEHRVSFSHPQTEERRVLGVFLNLGPYPVSGSAATINHDGCNQLNPFLVNTVASWRQVVDMAGPEEALGICAPGQSGHPLSAHARDQLQTWLRGEYFPLLFRHSAIRTLPRLVLQPGPEPQSPVDQQADAAD